MSKRSDVSNFYEILGNAELKMGGCIRFSDVSKRVKMPSHGVYFFRDPSEPRSGGDSKGRVVRVGTHALTEKSRSTLWSRLRQHRGTLKTRGGNHRGSIFRLLVGEAIINQEAASDWPLWGIRSTASKDQRMAELHLEQRVSEYIGNLEIICVHVTDPPGPDSFRGYFERQCIALLSGFNEPAIDPASKNWLGLASGRERVRHSGIWNNRHVDETYDPKFLDHLRNLDTAIDTDWRMLAARES